MSNRENSKTPDDGKVTREEFRNIVKAMDKDGFDNIMEQYVKEISDPNNISESNQYLKEAEKTNDLPKNVKLAEPKRGLCIKSEKFSIKRPGMRQKVYINICSYDGVKPPKEDTNNMWSLPHLLNKGRNDQDKKGNLCTTFDVVFNQEAIKLSGQSMAFKKFVCDTAINGINNNLLKASQEKVSGDYVLKKYEYKGKEVALINVHSLVAGELDSRKEPNENFKTSMQKEIDEIKEKKDNNNDDDEDRIFDKPDMTIDQSHMELTQEYPITPKYKIKYSDEFELHKFFYNPSADVAPQYKKLIIEIEVPLLDNLNQAELQLENKKLNLKYKEFYLLDLNLPIEVDKEKSDAKFDRKKHVLTISAVIVRKNVEVIKIKEDENMEVITEESIELEEKQKKEEENEKKEKENNKINLDSQVNKHIEHSPPAKEPIPIKEKNEIISSNIIKREMLEIENKSENDLQKEIIKTKEEENSLVKKDTPLITEIAIKDFKDEDDIPELDNKLPTDKDTNKNNAEDTIKISYINFNCDIIYDIE